MNSRDHILIAIGILIVSTFEKLNGGDLFWHLELGNYFIEHGEFLRKDIYSHTFAGRDIVPHAPLFQIMVALTHSVSGWVGLIFLRSSLLVGIFLLMLHCTRRLGGTSHWITPYIVLPIVWIAYPQLMLHPQLVSFVLFLAIIAIYLHHEGTCRTPFSVFLALVILLVWPWFHPSYPLGVAISLLFGTVYCVRSRETRYYGLCWIGTGLLALTVTGLAEPRFIKNVITHGQSDNMFGHIDYWRPIWFYLKFDSFSILLGVTAFLLLVGVLYFFVITRRFKKPWEFSLPWLVIGVMFLGAKALRFYPFYFFALAPMAIVSFKRKCIKGPQSLAATLAWVVLCLLTYLNSPSYQFGVGYDKSNVPYQCVDYLIQNPQEGNMFNTYDFGGYIMFTIGPEVKVFIDPRSSQLYSDKFFKYYLQAHASPKLFGQLAERFNINFAVLSKQADRSGHLPRILERKFRWHRIFEGDNCTVHSSFSKL